MICRRCGDLLVEDRFLDWTARWRCLKCGHIQDSASVQSYLEHQKKISFLKGFFLKSAEPNHFEEDAESSSRTIHRT
jgi:phage FluMu protein Com